MRPKIRLTRWHVTLSLAITLFVLSLIYFGQHRTFGAWSLGVLSPDCEDARGITAAIESARDGYKPWIDNPHDPWGRKFNYPRVWLGLGALGIDQSDTGTLAIIFTCLFFCGLLVMFLNEPGSLAPPIMLGIAFSPAVMLGIKCGNIDQAMFFLVVLAISGIASKRGLFQALGAAAVLVGLALKLFPIFAAAAILCWEGKKRIITLCMVSLITGAYLIVHWQEIMTIRQITPMSAIFSYGRDVFWMRLSQESVSVGGIARWISWLGIAAGFSLASFGILEGRKNGDGHSPGRRSRIAFHAGAAIYCGTFLLGNNWDYRLMFLILTVPYLASLAGGPASISRIASRVTICCIIISCWHLGIWNLMRHFPYGSPLSVIIDEACNWTVFLGLAYVQGLSLRRISGNAQDELKIDFQRCVTHGS